MSTKAGRPARTGTPDLEPRALPVQKRSRKTVELLLETSARLLDEVGVDGFNTNLLAERAGVGIRTVYRYFPNKLAIVTALATDVASVEQGFLDRVTEAATDGTNDWREVVGAMLDSYLAGTRTTPGLVPIRRAVQALPELREVEHQLNVRLARTLSVALRVRGLDTPPARLQAVARTVVEATTAIVAQARNSRNGAGSARGNGREFDPRLIAELRLMIENYLTAYLDPPGKAAKAAKSAKSARSPRRSRARRGST